MLDLPRLQRIRLSTRPRAQRAVAWGVLGPNYATGVHIVLEGVANIPNHPVLFAMNHTDRYNYWPFQWRLYRDFGRFTATWVKGKYYENAFVGGFMERMNNIPTVSRGYLITRDFLGLRGVRPGDADYRALRGLVDAEFAGRSPDPDGLEYAETHIADVLSTGRDMLGRRFDPTRESYPAAVCALFDAMMRRFNELNAEAIALGLDLLVFPEGTRSVRLGRGRIGVAEIALRHGVTVVPVGCNGCHQVYPGENPFARPGRIVYRIGEPIRYGDAAAFHIGEDFEPFSADAERRHRDRFQGYVDLLMGRIEALLDPGHRPGDGGRDKPIASRFV